MQLRYLKRAGARSFVWPPVGSRDGLRDTAKLRLEGVLTNVLRIGDRLSVTIRFEGRDHVALLDAWKPPPTMDEVEAALRSGVSQTVQAVGLVDTQQGHSVPAPLTPMRPTPVPPAPDDHGY
jgi:hypothetical protein